MSYIDVIKREAERYGWGILLIAKEEFKIFLDTLTKRFGKIRLLDVGAWKCYLYSWLKQNGYDVNYVGIDIIEPQGRIQEAEFYIMSPNALLFNSASFHAVVMIETLEHILDYVGALRECYRVLVRQGGIFIQSTICTDECATKDETHLHVLHPVTLRRLLARIGFREIQSTFNGNFAVWGFKV